MTNSTSNEAPYSTGEGADLTIIPLDDPIAAACPWLYRFIQFGQQWSPRSYPLYHEAVGIWVLSTVCAGRVAFDFGKRRHPSLYILLIGRTSVSAKTTVAEIGKSVLEAAGLEWLLLPDTCTPQKMVNEMTLALPDSFDQLSKDDQTKLLRKCAFAGQRGWYSDEFGGLISGMIRADGPLAEFRSLLRRLDDAVRTHQNGTISRGIEVVDRPYLALLAACTPADLAPYARKGSALWGDGFLARYALIAAPTDFLHDGMFPEGERVVPPELTRPLTEWHNRLGCPQVHVTNGTPSVAAVGPSLVVISPEVRDAYYAYDRSLRAMIIKSANADLDGNYSRLPEMALRIAALFASFEGNQDIEPRHWDGARTISEHWRESLHQLYEQLRAERGSAAYDEEDRVIEVIAQRQPATLRVLRQYSSVPYNRLRPIVRTLLDEGIIRKVCAGKTELYCLEAPAADQTADEAG